MVRVAIHVHGEFQGWFFDPVAVARFASMRRRKGPIASARATCFPDLMKTADIRIEQVNHG